MSGGASKRFGENEDFELLLSKSDIRDSSYRKHSLWMAHWTRDGHSAEPQNSKSCSPFDEIDDVGYSKDCGNLPFELMKARVAERLMVGVSHGGASSGNTQQFSSNMWGVAHDVCQEVQCKNTDQFNRPFERSVVQKNLNIFSANTVVSERFSVHKPSDLSVDSHRILSSDNLSSEWSHFPMFAINRKIDSILNPRRSSLSASSDKIFVPRYNLKANISASNTMAFSSKEYQFHTHQVTDDENMTHCKSAGDIQPHQDDRIGLNSDLAGRKVKGHLSVEETCSCSKDETNSLGSPSKGSPYWSSKNNDIFSAGRKDDEIVEPFLEQKLGTSEQCQKQEGLEEVVIYEPALDREYQMKSVDASSISKGIDVDINGQGITFANSLQGEQQHRSTRKVDSAVNFTEISKLLDKIGKKPAMKSKGETLACRKPPKQKLTHSKQKGSCLFEMLTLPSKSHLTCSKDPIYSGNSRSNTSRCSLETQKQFSTKIDTLYSDTHPASKSMAGFASTSTQKDSGFPDSEKTERVVSSSTKRVSSCCEGNETVNMSLEHQNSYSKATCTSKQEWSIPKTSSMNLDLVLFQISRMGNPISKALTESPVCSDPSDKWLKRLKCDSSDPHVPCSKKQKTGDTTTPGCPVFGQVLDYKRDSTCMIKHMKEDQLMHETMMDQQNQDASTVSTKNLNHWIGRWCQGGSPSFHGVSSPGKQSRKSNTPPDCLEGQFPSIAAMAMMGRVMNKLRPCELEKRGPSVVWKTEGL